MTEEFELFERLQRGENLSISDWGVQRLKEVCQFEYGDGLTEDERDGGEYPVYGSAGIVGHHSEPYVEGEGVITARKGSIGEVSYATNDFYPIDTTYYVSQEETDENLRWLYYTLSLLNLDRVNASTAIPSLNRNDAGNLRVPVPPVGEQERIVSVLYTVDQHVDALAQRHDYLHDLKHALLQDLFSGNKRVGPETDVIEEVAPEPSPVENRDDWKDKKIEHICRIQNGGTPDTDTDEYWGGDIPWFTTSEMTDSDHPTSLAQGKYITKKALEDGGAKLFDRGSVVLASRGTVGQTKVLPTDASVNQSNYVLDPEESVNPYYLHYAIQSERPTLESIAVGGTFDSVTKRELAIFDIPVPPLWEQERIASVLYTVDEMIARTRELRDEYEQLKCGLMQDLLSGEVRTPESLETRDEVVKE